MARKTVRAIFCWSIQLEELAVYLASTEKGALQVGLTLKPKGDCIAYFKAQFPDSILDRDKRANHSLIQGVRTAFMNQAGVSIPDLDVTLTPFQRKVLFAITDIPFGETRTYGEVAAMVGRPKGPRAIGQVMAGNPLPLIFP